MGLTYEEFTADKSWVTQARTVTEADVAQFCGLSGDFNPLHSDEVFSRDSSFGTRVAHGPLVMSMAIGLMSQLNLINGTALGLLNLNWDFLGPVRLGDTIHTRVAPAKSRRSRTGDGVVTLSFEVVNQDGATVQKGAAILLMKSGRIADSDAPAMPR